MSLLRLSALLLLLPLTACTEGPEKVAAGPTPPPADSHAGHDHANNPHDAEPAMGAATGEMPNDATHGGAQSESPHGAQGPDGEVVTMASGEAELAGDYAGVVEGFLFVTSINPETGGKGHSAKVAVADGKLNAAGHQVVPFKLTTGDFSMGAVMDENYELKVQYDHDGFVNMGGSAEGTGTVIVPVKRGQSDVRVTISKMD